MNGSPDRTAETDERAELLTPAEVAQMFHVDPKTVTRWAQAGKLSYMRTLGGHRRYHRSEVIDLLKESAGEQVARGV
ncbi:BldC family transcriptional regulator [Brachybacterium sp. DNPG3]